jgi:hypothetical protein
MEDGNRWSKVAELGVSEPNRSENGVADEERRAEGAEKGPVPWMWRKKVS